MRKKPITETEVDERGLSLSYKRSAITHGILVVVIAFLSGGLAGYAAAEEKPYPHLEKDYVALFCKPTSTSNAKFTQEFQIRDTTITRVDCMIERDKNTGNSYSVEADFSSKWAESYSQAMYYAYHTGAEPGVVLIQKRGTTDDLYAVHYNRLQQLINYVGKPVWVVCMNPDGEVVGCPK